MLVRTHNASGQNLLRVHHGQPAPGDLHRNHQPYREASPPAQIAYVRWIHGEIQRNLVYFERYGSVMKAIRREKELKDSRREKKIELIESSNPKWRDLSYGWYQPTRLPAAQNLLSPS